MILSIQFDLYKYKTVQIFFFNVEKKDTLVLYDYVQSKNKAFTIKGNKIYLLHMHFPSFCYHYNNENLKKKKSRKRKQEMCPINYLQN